MAIVFKRHNISGKAKDKINCDKYIMHQIRVRLHDAFAGINVVYPLAVYYAILKYYEKD